MTIILNHTIVPCAGQGGDKVMQIENDYDKEVYNGDIGDIDDVGLNAGEITSAGNGWSSSSRLRQT
jgi:hypothetical protein